MQLAKDAKELGIEMVVMDNGWFGKRDGDCTGLGDWFVNEKKIGSIQCLPWALMYQQCQIIRQIVEQVYTLVV